MKDNTRNITAWKASTLEMLDYTVHDDIHDMDMLFSAAPATVRHDMPTGPRDDSAYTFALVSPLYGDEFCRWIATDLMSNALVHDYVHEADLLFQQERHDDENVVRFHIVNPYTGVIIFDFSMTCRMYGQVLSNLYLLTHDEHGNSIAAGL